MDYGEDTRIDDPNEYNKVVSDLDEQWDPAVESLEPGVFDSHKEFVEDAYVSTQGPNSANVERDDAQDVNKRWGLKRVDYTSAISHDDARTVSSEYPDQLAATVPSSFVL